MALTITGDSIRGDRTRHTARLVPGHQDAWEVSWLPGRLLDRSGAITAMLLADITGSGAPHAGDRLWPHIEGWAAEIGVTAPEVLAQVAQSPARSSPEKDATADADPEAAG